MKKRRELTVVVNEVPGTFDFDAWARAYVAAVLRAEGYQVPLQLEVGGPVPVAPRGKRSEPPRDQ